MLEKAYRESISGMTSPLPSQAACDIDNETRGGKKLLIVGTRIEP